MLVKAQKRPVSTWHDFYHEIKIYSPGRLAGLQIETFEKLKDLMLVDEIKRRAPIDFKEHLLDEWALIICPTDLASKWEEFEDAKKNYRWKNKVRRY